MIVMSLCDSYKIVTVAAQFGLSGLHGKQKKERNKLFLREKLCLRRNALTPTASHQVLWAVITVIKLIWH